MHLDLNSGAGGMLFGTLSALKDWGAESVNAFYEPTVVLRRTLLANFLTHAPGADPWMLCRYPTPCASFSGQITLITAQLINGYTQGTYKRHTALDLTDTFETLKLIQRLMPQNLLIAVAKGFDQLDAGGLLKYVITSIHASGLRNTRVIQTPQMDYILGSVQVPKEVLLSNDTHTLRELLKGVPKSTGSKFTPKTASYFAEVSPGTSYSGDKYHRLSWDSPRPVLTVGMAGASAYCHPDELRPLTIAEVRRIQGFPDTWVLEGTLREQYRALIQSPNPQTVKAIVTTALKDIIDS